MFHFKHDKHQQTLREFSLVTTTEPSHSAHVAGRTVLTSIRLQQVTTPNMKDRPKDLGLVLQCKGFLKLFVSTQFSNESWGHVISLNLNEISRD